MRFNNLTVSHNIKQFSDIARLDYVSTSSTSVRNKLNWKQNSRKVTKSSVGMLSNKGTLINKNKLWVTKLWKFMVKGKWTQTIHGTVVMWGSVPWPRTLGELGDPPITRWHTLSPELQRPSQSSQWKGFFHFFSKQNVLNDL